MMNFLSKIGLGNLAVILALAALPFVMLVVTLVLPGEPQSLRASVESGTPAASEPAPR